MSTDPGGYLALVLHAHLPFVRHPEHDRFLEENWLFEAITETYLPLLQRLEGWERDGIGARLTLTLTPPLCAMLRDPLLQSRYQTHLDGLIDLAERELHRTHWEPAFQELALFYHARFQQARRFYGACGGDLVGAFRARQEAGQIEIAACAATHAVLPLLVPHPPSLRAQVRVGCDEYRRCFGRDPRGLWLPECAYCPELEPILREANLQWFITDTHGLLHASPRPRFGPFAPVFTPGGLAAFARDAASASQVWSRHEGYPGDPRYRDFYRDAGYDLDWDYVRPYLAIPDRRSNTGLKYYRITGGADKAVYQRQPAMQAADDHARHFLAARLDQLRRLRGILNRPPLLVCPYDAELFGHWWYEGPEFLDLFARKACFDQREFTLVTLEEYLRRQPTQQVAAPAASSWGQEGHLAIWLNEKNHRIYTHLAAAQERMTVLAQQAARIPVPPGSPEDRALRQAARELLLAQASDWPFILRTGTSPEYASRRVTSHLQRFTRLYEQLRAGQIDPSWLGEVESADNLFPTIDYRYWARP